MRRVLALCAVAGVASSVFAGPASAKVGYYVIRWDNTGICQVWNEDLKYKPFQWGVSTYKVVSKPLRPSPRPPSSRSSCAASAAARSEPSGQASYQASYRGRVAQAARPLLLRRPPVLSREYSDFLCGRFEPDPRNELLTSCPGRRLRKRPRTTLPVIVGRRITSLILRS